MGQWWCEYSHDYYDTEDKAREAALEFFNIFDIQDYLIDVPHRFNEMLEELARLNSPLYYKLLEEAEANFLEEAIGEYEDDDEETEWYGLTYEEVQEKLKKPLDKLD
jgi:hypothetical protein